MNTTEEVAQTPNQTADTEPPSRHDDPLSAHVAILQNGSIPPESPKLQTPPALAEKYLLEREIGKGTQGHIYLAKRLSDGEKVAIKELRIDSIQNWKAYDLFQRESQVLSTLNIRGVAKFYESIEALESPHPRAYIVQEYINGSSLEQMVKNGYRFTPAQFFSFAEALLIILDQLHHHAPPIIHRDIKPSNIMLVPSEKKLNTFDLYLIDFGAVANPQVQGGGSTVAGTYGYMPPEQLTGCPTPASDFYSLAAMMASLLSGVSPDEMQVSDFHLVIDTHLENIPRSVVCILQMMLEPDPSSRLADHKLLKQVFHEFSLENYNIAALPEKVRTRLAKEKSISAKEFNKRLQAVKQLNQTGNTELWMQLPEFTPRKVPKCYRKSQIRKRDQFNIKTRDQYDILITHNTKKRNQTSFDENITNAYMILLLFIMPLSAVAYIEFKLRSFSFVIFLILLLIFPYLLIRLFYSCDNIKDSSNYTRKNVYGNADGLAQSGSSFNKSNKPDFIVLLKQGRKTIATVVSVEYVPPDNNAIFNLHYQSFPSYFSAQPPRFKIRYKFNPPDDSESSDLIHEFYVSNDVRKELTLGSPTADSISISSWF